MWIYSRHIYGRLFHDDDSWLMMRCQYFYRYLYIYVLYVHWWWFIVNISIVFMGLIFPDAQRRKLRGITPKDGSNISGTYPIGSMVLLYMVCHGSHQYTPFMLALIYQHHGSVMGMWTYHRYMYHPNPGTILRHLCWAYIVNFQKWLVESSKTGTLDEHRKWRIGPSRGTLADW
jgi:hypothetical protein